ncbi:MAG: glucose-1-phosphate adenylyltransferase [Bacteroidota bacterium]
MHKNTICLILGGGAGTRLYPLTKDRSKPAVPIGAKYRLIDIPISNCLHANLRHIFVLTQFNSASLNHHIKNTYNFDAFSHGFVEILAAEQTPQNKNWFQGTADAVRQSLHHLRHYAYDQLLILSGDQLYQMDLEALLRQHQKNGAEITIATKPVSEREARGFGIMKVDQKDRITAFVEKPSPTQLPRWSSKINQQGEEGFLASMGIYVFSKKAINQLFLEMPEATDFGKEIIPKAIQSGYDVESYSFNGYWTDIGTVASFFKANLDLAKNSPNFDLHAQLATFTRPQMVPPTRILDTLISQSLIAEGSQIRAEKIQQSIIGLRSKIGRHSKIIRSILFGNEELRAHSSVKQGSIYPAIGIGNHCFIKNAIIDKDCRIGDHVSIVGDPSLENVEKEQYSIIDGIVVLKKGAYIPDGTTIGLHQTMDSKLKLELDFLLEEVS